MIKINTISERKITAMETLTKSGREKQASEFKKGQ